MSHEVNFDGLVGPTHNYSGLSYGNLASQENKHQLSNPKEAALQGLQKMKLLTDLGVKQAVLPPHERPHLPTLRALGFGTTDSAILKALYSQDPQLLATVSSSSYMWAANAATVSPSSDTIDQHLHITPANLSSNFHRSIESVTTQKALRLYFNNSVYFTHHDALPPGLSFSDEGAANHCRFCKDHGGRGVQLFVFGSRSFNPGTATPRHFPARQSYEASCAIARLHRLFPENTIFAQQHPAAIDTGAFHNDVVAVSNQHLFLFHEKAFLGKDALKEEIKRKTQETCEIDMLFIEVLENEIPLQDAIRTYFFNSQIVTLPDGSMCLLAPTECLENARVKAYIDNMVASTGTPITRVHFIDLHQSMRNGGGPACLRLRVVMNDQELSAMHQPVLYNDHLHETLQEWVMKHYRDRLELKDLADPLLLRESQAALNELATILQLGHFY